MKKNNTLRKEMDRVLSAPNMKKALTETEADAKAAKSSRADREYKMERDSSVFTTEYDPRMCDEVLLGMGEGLSREEVAVQLNITYSTLCSWEQEYPAFRRSLLDGHYRSMAWWITQGRTNLCSYTGEKFNSTLYTFMMKNRFGFTDVQKVAESKEIAKEEEKEKEDLYEDIQERKVKGASSRERQTAEIISILTAVGADKVTDSKTE